jgi:REP element-mobilizing transposase RayT
MARPLRIEFAGALYHVTSRGDGQEAIYLDDVDREAFDAALGEVCERFNWAVHAACQMTNHYHLLIETPDGNLSAGMRQLNGLYTQRFNRRHGRVGHVFQGRYKAILVEKEPYLLELARYIVLNPVRAGMVRAVKDWTWSSYRATAGLASPPPWLHTDSLLGLFAKRRRTACERYRAFVAAGKGQPSPWEGLKHQIYLGSETFVEAMQRARPADTDLSEIPAVQKRPPPKPLSHYAKRHADRDTAIAQAYAGGGYTLKQIGEHFGLHYSRVSRIARRVELAKGKT